MPTKVCSPTKGCGIEKDVVEFTTKENYCDHICKQCKREKNKIYYKNNKDRIKEYKKRYKQNNPEKIKQISKKYKENNREKEILHNSRYRSKKKGLEHDITIEDIQIPEHCPVLGIKLTNNIGSGPGPHGDSISLDRIDNNKGYIKGNVKVISMRANQLKNDATIEELEKILAYMREQQNQQQEEGDHDSEATDR